MKQLLSSASMVAALILPVAALADNQPAATSAGAATFSAVVTSIDGKSSLTVRDSRGSLDSVTLHKGTIINPTGAELKPGTPVTIVGHADGRAYDADTINAPLDAATRSARAAERTPAEAPVPMDIPSGTFQTDGPSAEGGG